MKNQSLLTRSLRRVKILHDREHQETIEAVLRANRPLSWESDFFEPTLSDLHDPFLLPDMDRAVERILEARDQADRIVIFGDYDVDGVSSTAILVRFLKQIGCEVSYRLPHRAHDGYGLKSYFFDELAEKSVKLVITVDCGTRDIEPIRHARSLGIDVIVTDHHAVPEVIPEEVVALVNPKRVESQYPFRELAGAGVAFKLLQALQIRLGLDSSILTEYIDLASLGTVADCMPILGENRTITTLWLRQMQSSKSVGLRKFLSEKQRVEGNADLIGYQIGPRINASGRMDTPLLALQWLLASESRADELFAELDRLNESRKTITTTHFEQARESVDLDSWILFYDSHEIGHGIIGLVAGRLTEIYHRPSIVFQNGAHSPLVNRKWDERRETRESKSLVPSTNCEQLQTPAISIASCRAPEWCNIIELLDECRDFFIRYGGHRQAAGFTIETDRIPAFREAILEAFSQRYDRYHLPQKSLRVESRITGADLTIETTRVIDRFRPFGIGNTKPLWLLDSVTITEIRYLGTGDRHIQLRIAEAPSLRLIGWAMGKGGEGEDLRETLWVGSVTSLIVTIERGEWQGRERVEIQVIETIV